MMRLSEAIRLGSMLRSQTFGSYFRGNRVCAWGGAYLSVGAETLTRGKSAKQKQKVDIEQGWNWINNLAVTCPCCSEVFAFDSEYDPIAHLNDIHRWTRERIADWVEGEERKLGLWPAEEVTGAVAVTSPVEVPA